jgi:hypothetical protein
MPEHGGGRQLPLRKRQDVRLAFGHAIRCHTKTFCATTPAPRNKTLCCVSSFETADASTRVRMCRSASLGATVATSY